MQQKLLTLLSFFGADAPVDPCKPNGEKITNVIPCSSSGGDPVFNLLTIVVNLMAVLVGLAVVFGIVFGAVLYASSAGSADQAKRGMGYIRNAIIALLLFIFMYAIINFIIPGGLFG